MSWLWRVLAFGLATVAVVAALESPLPYSEAREPRQRPAARRELHQQEMRVKRARRVTRRILNDERASPDVKRQAGELDQLLDNRERLIANLEALHREFLAQHQADVTELTELRRRAMEVDARLRAARDTMLKAHAAEVEELRTGAARVEDLIDALGDAYGRQKRQRRESP
jgi:hypothetical protein